MRVIEKPIALRGTVTVPGDKSISHRSVMLGAIAEGDTYVRGFLKSEDCEATIECFRKLGIVIEEKVGISRQVPGCAPDERILVIHGKGLRGLRADDGVVLDCRNSGTTARLLAGILSGQNFISHLTGDDSLKERPMDRIIQPLEYMGIMAASDHNDGRLPLRIFGGKPAAIRYGGAVASAQVKSCVLFAGLYASDPTFYTEPSLSRNHTELMLGSFGANLKTKRQEDGSYQTILYPGTILKGQTVTVPGDISSAAYFLAAGLIVPNSRILLKGVGINETRDGILRVIRAMGGNVEISGIRMEGYEPVADLLVSSSRLHGTTIGGSMIPALIDEIPVIAVMAAAAEGRTVIRDAGELRVKETDRLAAVSSNLRRMGIRVETSDDGIVIEGGKLKGATIDPAGDHRIAMAFAVAGLVSEGRVTITDDTCVGISYPGFFRDLMMLE